VRDAIVAFAFCAGNDRIERRVRSQVFGALKPLKIKLNGIRLQPLQIATFELRGAKTIIAHPPHHSRDHGAGARKRKLLGVRRKNRFVLSVRFPSVAPIRRGDKTRESSRNIFNVFPGKNRRVMGLTRAVEID
jgi:hypothetical protein